MINVNRIVPMTATDLLTNFAASVKLVQDLSGSALEILEAGDVGIFAVAANNKIYLANEPVRELDFAAAATAGTVYFIADYSYKGFSLAGAAEETAGAEVNPDGRTLYKAVLSSGTITISVIG